MGQTDPGPAPLRENGRNKWKVLKKRVKLHFQHHQSKFNKGTPSLLCLSEEDSNREKKVFSILDHGLKKIKKKIKNLKKI